MIIVFINGFPKAGKTTFINQCIEHYKNSKINIYNFSSIDCVKQYAKEYLNWNGEKTSEWRKTLSELKVQLEQKNGLITNSLIESIENCEKGEDDTIIFIDVREPLEIKRLSKLFTDKFNCFCYTLLINRLECTKNTEEFSNDSDKYVQNYDYDFIIYNNYSIKELKESGIMFCEDLLFKDKVKRNNL